MNRLDLESLAERHIDPRSLERGRAYHAQGRVLKAQLDASGELIAARVRGSRGAIYHCTIGLRPDPSEGWRLLGHCSCPIGFNCKHVAASLLAVARQPAHVARLPGVPPPAAEALPREMAYWLAQAKQLAEQPRSAAPTTTLLYRLDWDPFSRPRRCRVRIEHATLNADGSWGTPVPSRLPEGEARWLPAVDRRIRALLLASAHERQPGESEHLLIRGASGADLLETLAHTGRAYWSEPAVAAGPPPVAHWSMEPPRIVLRWRPPLAAEPGWTLGADARLRVALAGSEHPGAILLPIDPPCWLDPLTGDCGLLDCALATQVIALLAEAPALTPDAVAPVRTALGQLAPEWQLPLPEPVPREQVALGPPVPELRLWSHREPSSPELRRWGMKAEPQWSDGLDVTFYYGVHPVPLETPESRMQRVSGGKLIEFERDREAEARALQTLADLGFVRAQEAKRAYLVRAEGDWFTFMSQDLPRLRQDGWRIRIEPEFRFQVLEASDWEWDLEDSGQGRWFDLALGVRVEGQVRDLLPLLVDLLRRDEAAYSPQALAALPEEATLPVQFADGRYVLMPVARLRPILSTLVELYDQRALTAEGRLRLAWVQSAELAELERQLPELPWSGAEAALAWGRRLRDFAGIQPIDPPAGLAAELRPYQRGGLDWLQFLREFALGGILADDMGLGKTVQCLAHLLVEQASGRADRPNLVVAPTSLMFNWRREAERFAPSLRVLVLHGPDRHARFDAIDDSDLVLTTYPLLPRDLDTLAAHDYHLLVLDEAQAVKNPRSRAAAAVRQLKARHRLCLTGTPLENHLGELWALMDFLVPGLLGDERRFRQVFRNPIERVGDTERQQQLRRRVTPFLLRRTKEEVATELPPKTEILREVALADDQRDLYETLRLALHERIRAEVARKGLARSGIVILDALLKLRQVCCDPRLVALEAARRVRGSAKLELLMELLTNLVDEGRRVLVFSQFASMLGLIEEALIAQGHVPEQGFVKLTGRTRNRSLPVDRFQAGEVPIFLISLKAGGSGLNLTAADTVIHYDPWWNPAVERQATDRAHRIGQDKPVFVYKLLTEGTVEQKVAELQARKQALADAMLAGGGAAAGALSAADLDLLFAPLGSD